MSGRPQTPEEYNQAHIGLLEKIIDKAVADPQWKEKLLSDPQAAFDEAGLLTEIDMLNPDLDEAEVRGQSLFTTFDCCYARTLIPKYTAWCPIR